MTFSDYLNILYPFFDWEQVQLMIAEKDIALNEEDTEAKPIFTSSRKSKAKFTKAVLISGLKKDAGCRKEFLHWKDDYYLKLFKGDKGRSALSVLSRINTETDINAGAFWHFANNFFKIVLMIFDLSLQNSIFKLTRGTNHQHCWIYLYRSAISTMIILVIKSNF